jgi:hypothetical protein
MDRAYQQGGIMQRPRTPSRIPESLHQRLNSYAIAASAAGVSLLALAQPAEGKIVYTATHHVIGKNSHYNLDLNHDGKTDFTISNTYSCSTEDFCRSHLFTTPTNGTQGVEGPGSAYALNRGARIGPRHHFSAWLLLIFSSGACNNDHWCNVTNRYLGFSFKIHGQPHYGWARLNVSTGGGIVATLTGYAYETVANKAIIAGRTHGKDVITVQDPSLGHLARGASAIPAWRAEQW